MSLIERAFEIQNRSSCPKSADQMAEEIEIAIEYAKGNLSISTVVKVLNLTSTTAAYSAVAIGLKRACEQKLVFFVDEKNAES